MCIKVAQRRPGESDREFRERVLAVYSPKTLMAEYLARRERAMDWLAAIAYDRDLAEIHSFCIKERGGRARWAWWVADTSYMKPPKPRDKRPLPLP